MSELASDLSAVPPMNQKYQARFLGSGESYAFVILKNLFFVIITLGVYAMWAKTNRRKFLWQNTELEGQRFAYTGTGRELAAGYAKVFGVYIVYAIVSKIFMSMPKPAPQLFQISSGVFLFLVIGYASYGTRAYLSRVTQYRGVRFGLDAAGKYTYVSTYVKWSLLTLFTLGIVGSIRANKLHRILMENSRFGSERFTYSGTDDQAFKITLRALPKMIFTLGIYYFWYHAEILRFRAAHTRFAGARAAYDVKGGDLVSLYLVNLLLVVFTAGLAIPWVVVRTVRFVAERSSLEGNIDFAAIAQHASEGSSLGDVAASALDVEFPL